MSPFTLTRTLPESARSEALRADVLAGLAGGPDRLRELPPKWLYDTRGSALFEDITRLPEYYQARAEREILLVRAAEIAALSGARTLVELGSGSSEKTRILLEALRDVRDYVPVDVSPDALTGAGLRLAAERPGLQVRALVSDFTSGLRLPPSGHPRTVAFLGGTVGNLLPAERAAFLGSVAALMEPGDTLLMGTDLVKEEEVLVAAYDDAAGVTAEFNRNVLAVLNRELGADFALPAFAHVALWDAEHEWIEMRLRSRERQTVKIPALDLLVPFAAGEELRTEISAKFREEGVRAELVAAGLEPLRWWTDSAGRFALSLAVRAG